MKKLVNGVEVTMTQNEIDDLNQNTTEEVLNRAKSEKIDQIKRLRDFNFGTTLLIRENYYVKPHPESNIFLAGFSMAEGTTKKWRAFDKAGNKLSVDGEPLFLELTKDELVSASCHYEDRKTTEYHQCDLRCSAVGKLTSIEEVEAFDITQIIDN